MELVLFKIYILHIVYYYLCSFVQHIFYYLLVRYEWPHSTTSLISEPKAGPHIDNIDINYIDNVNDDTQNVMFLLFEHLYQHLYEHLHGPAVGALSAESPKRTFPKNQN